MGNAYSNLKTTEQIAGKISRQLKEGKPYEVKELMALRGHKF